MNTVTSKDGTKIAYDQTGHGQPLILVGGAFSYRKFAGLLQLVGLLSKDFTVINYDRRGRGDSGDTQPYAVEREIEDLAALIDAVGGEAYVWGTSSGAVLSLKAAAHGLNIAKLAIYEPPFNVDRSVPLPPSNFIQHLQTLTAQNRRGDIIRFFMKSINVPAIFVTMMRFMPGVWSRLKAVAHTVQYDAMLLEGHIEGKLLESAEFAAITMPTCVINGDKSPISLQNTAKALMTVLPNAEHHVLAGQTHNVSMEVLAPVLIEFFTNESVSNEHHFDQQLETA